MLQPLNSNISSSDGFFILFYSISFYIFNSKFITFELGSLRLLSATHLQLTLFIISTQYTVYNSYTAICLHPKFYLYCGIFSYFFFFSKFSLKMLSVSLSLDHTISVVVSSNFHFNDNRMAIQLSVECRRSVLLDHSHEFYEYHRDFWGSEISFLFPICSFFSFKNLYIEICTGT